MKIKLQCYDPKRNKYVSAGHILGEEFIKKVVPSKHLIRKYNAYAIQEDVVQILENENVTKITFSEPAQIYQIGWFDFLKYSILEDMGHGQQRIVPLSRCKKIASSQMALYNGDK